MAPYTIYVKLDHNNLYLHLLGTHERGEELQLRAGQLSVRSQGSQRDSHSSQVHPKKEQYRDSIQLNFNRLFNIFFNRGLGIHCVHV